MADPFRPLPERIVNQIEKAGLPLGGEVPFRPMLGKNRLGEDIIEKRAIHHGPKRGKRGWVDDQSRIWIRDPAHADVPDHWDVQFDDGLTYVRVGFDGSLI
jgi:hypothetical protein